MIGEVVGSYRVLHRIGQGGMGAVYLAEHTLIGRQAAIKVLLPQYSVNQSIVQRFFNEAVAATQIKHPGIVEVYDFGFHEDGGHKIAYIVMEHLEGETLSERLKRMRRLAPDHALRLTRQVASALNAAHKKSIVHRDLKPDNIFIVRDPDVAGGERIKLLDFGIAKLAGDGGLAAHTQTGAVMGTPTYMSPEQCRGAGHVDHRADLYSLGCILFKMLSGRPPFQGQGHGDLIALQITAPPPLIFEQVPDLPRAAGDLVMSLLVKDPGQRPQSARAVADAIDAMDSGSAVRSGTASDTYGSSPGVPAAFQPGAQGAPGHGRPDTHGRPDATPAPGTTLGESAATIMVPGQPMSGSRTRSRGVIAATVIAVMVAAGVAVGLVNTGGDPADPGAALGDADPETVEPAPIAAGADGADDPAEGVLMGDLVGEQQGFAAVDVAAGRAAGGDPAAAEPEPEAVEPPPVGPLFIELTSSPSGASVYEQRDGKRIALDGTTPVDIEVADSDREYVLVLDGYEDKTVEVPAGVGSIDPVALTERRRTRTRSRSKPSSGSRTDRSSGKSSGKPTGKKVDTIKW